jgi:hypothetical protein
VGVLYLAADAAQWQIGSVRPALAWDGHYPLSGCASPGYRSFGMGIVEFATQIILRADMEGKRCIIVSLILPLAIQEKREAVLPASPSLER